MLLNTIMNSSALTVEPVMIELVTMFASIHLTKSTVDEETSDFVLVESEEEEFEFDGDEYNGYYTQDQMREKFQ